MPKPPLAKNIIRKALRAIVDPEPRKKEIYRLWEYFGSTCAYCGCPLDRKLSRAHIDHLIPGLNHISNRVLACPTCNGNEKREEPWLDFLRKKVVDQTIFETRKQRIESWVASQLPSEPLNFDAKMLRSEIDNVVAAFDIAVKRLRSAKI